MKLVRNLYIPIMNLQRNSIWAENNRRGTYSDINSYEKKRKKMKTKNQMLFLSCIFLSIITVNCASTPKEPRSIKATANTVANLRATKAIIENYDMEIVYDNSNENSGYINFPSWDFKTKELIIAQNHENDESIVFATFEHLNLGKFRFAYLSINGEKTSVIKHDDTVEGTGGISTVYLNNYDSICMFNERGRNIVLVDPADWTKSLVNIREYIEFTINYYFPLQTFDEEINPNQLELSE